ncbi:cupredoxin family copper-binding protein [Actinokineospora sp. NBRC 105648]|uniref:cupredoxin domain-containing protein n=1 Tax=Actinokineospora sp. NBRC 105648 TaxID=3032206 RepID=UPI0024A49847|nr:cupredoxin family copper-binding protein [Actinokineospora sp. NBRC 105648]GLZ41943.1 hypothetical protein Acsp05_55670 [Actinokineospora sp. NBRC 105648]
MRATVETGRVRRVLAAALLLTAAGCGGSGTSTPAGSAAPASSAAGQVASGEATVEVKQFTFTPAALTVAVGTKVTWKFLDSAKHNVKANDGSFKSDDLAGGATYSYTFTKAGEFPYICTIHQYMTATVTVR